MTAVTRSDLPVVEADVVVVGAGPTGLMAGLVLTRAGLSTVIADRKSGPTRESRALAVQARTMEIYDQLGLADRVLAGAQPATRFQLGQDGRAGFSFEHAQQADTRYPGLHVFEQSRNEQLLSDALGEAGTAVRWQHRLVDLLDETDNPGGRVEALLEGPDGLVRIRARWCVGADGAASPVRRLLDVPFEGVTDDATFWVADLQGVPGLPGDAVVARIGVATFALAFPLGPGGHVRLISMANSDTVNQETVLAVARRELGLSYTAVDWFSAYRVHHRVAARFRVGGTFLAGDAAHVHSPVGGQGMNTGLQDAHDLATLLADVARGRLEPAALDRYERERRPVALHLIRVTDRLFGVIARRDRRTAWLRRGAGRVVGSLAPRVLDTPLGARAGGWLGQYRIHYELTDGTRPTPTWADDRPVGRRLPPVGDNQASLRAFRWQLHAYGTTVLRPEVPGWIDGPRDFGSDVRGRVRSDRLYLVRPDGFVAASLPVDHGVADPADVRAALRANHVVTGSQP